jgi:hypothetical protein
MKFLIFGDCSLKTGFLLKGDIALDTFREAQAKATTFRS